MKSTWWQTGVAGMALLALSACASIARPSLPDGGDGLRPVAMEEGEALRVSGALRWGAVQVEEVVWQAGSEIAPAQRQKLCELLQGSLQRALVGPEPAELPALRVRARIVEVVGVSPALNVASALLIIVPVDRGGAAVQIEALDAASGRRLASLALGEAGRLGDFSGYFSRYAHAEDVLRRAAVVFRNLLERDRAPS